MKVFFDSERLANRLQSGKTLRKEFGSENAKWIPKRLDNLRFAEDLEQMRSLPGKTHELHGDRAGTFAINLKHGFRIIFKPADDPPPRKVDGGLDWQAIRSIVIIAVENYHD